MEKGRAQRERRKSMSMGNSSRLLTCSLCGREFSYASLRLHQKECTHKMKLVNQAVPKAVRQPMPSLPSQIPQESDSPETYKVFNEKQTKIYREFMPKCPCGRSFGHDRIETHLGICQPQILQKSPEKCSPKKSLFQPRHVLCYLCGHEFSYASIKIHQRDCPSKAESLVLLVPKTLRQPLPGPPELPIPNKDDPPEVYKNYNNQAEQIFLGFMPKCLCGRRFGHDRISAHFQRCQPDLAAAEEATLSSPKSSSRRPRHVICYLCGHEFSFASIKIHQKDCPTKAELLYRLVPKALQQSLPNPPELQIPTETDPPEVYVNYNEVAEKIHRNFMPQCPCGRRFVHDRILVHLRSCRPDLLKDDLEEQSPKPKSRKLRHVFCYLCGQEFSYASIKIHQKDCPTKVELLHQLVPKVLRQPLPDPPEMAIPNEGDSLDVYDAYNDIASELFRFSRPKCPCGRRFGHDRILVHLRSCCPELLIEEEEPVPKSEGRKLRHVFCYICGREFSYASIKIHLRDCPNRAQSMMELIPKILRQPIPKAPKIPLPTESDSHDVYDAYNEAASAVHKTAQPQCVCGRRFRPDRLLVHLKSCNPKLLVEEEVSPYPRPPVDDKPSRFLHCHLCCREFSPMSLKHHLKECFRRRENEEYVFPVQMRQKVSPSIDLPIPGRDGDLVFFENYNKMATAVFKESLLTCPSCLQHFTSENLIKHLGKCYPTLLENHIQGNFQLSPIQNREVTNSFSIRCHFCGILTTEPRHLELCRKQHLFDCRQLPEETKVTTITHVDAEIPTTSPSPVTIKRYNASAFRILQSHTARCPNCSYSGVPILLLAHLKKCCPKLLGRRKSLPGSAQISRRGISRGVSSSATTILAPAPSASFSGVPRQRLSITEKLKLQREKMRNERMNEPVQVPLVEEEEEEEEEEEGNDDGLSCCPNEVERREGVVEGDGEDYFQSFHPSSFGWVSAVVNLFSFTTLCFGSGENPLPLETERKKREQEEDEAPPTSTRMSLR